MTTDDYQALERQRDQLFDQATLMMAAQDANGAVEMGVTPFIRHDGAFFIFPSQLSRHVRALLEQTHGQFMLIADESATANQWARRRLKFNADIETVSRTSEEFTGLCDMFAERHGPTTEVIRDFTDFHMLRLHPTDGVMVLGFAAAYALEGTALRVGDKLRSG